MQRPRREERNAERRGEESSKFRVERRGKEDTSAEANSPLTLLPCPLSSAGFFVKDPPIPLL